MRTSMRTAVLQATAIYLFSEVLHHHTSSDIFDGFLGNEGVQNFTAVMNKTSSVVAASASATSSRMTLGDNDTANQTRSLGNTTLPNDRARLTFEHPFDEPFYGLSLCRRLITRMMVSVLQYCWFMCLERTLPARPRKDSGDLRQSDNDGREEEVVKKWISQGRVNRASLNWCNTFLKWVLDLTIGRFLYHSTELVISACLRWELSRFIRQIKTHLVWSFVGGAFSITPIATLVALIAIPAHNQLVFVAGAELVGSLFIVTLVRILTTWVVKTDFAQIILRNMTDRAERQLRAGKTSDDPWSHGNEL